jgi:hypothetical protein
VQRGKARKVRQRIVRKTSTRYIKSVGQRQLTSLESECGHGEAKLNCLHNITSYFLDGGHLSAVFFFSKKNKKIIKKRLTK